MGTAMELATGGWAVGGSPRYVAAPSRRWVQCTAHDSAADVLQRVCNCGRLGDFDQPRFLAVRAAQSPHAAVGARAAPPGNRTTVARLQTKKPWRIEKPARNEGWLVDPGFITSGRQLAVGCGGVDQGEHIYTRNSNHGSNCHASFCFVVRSMRAFPHS